MPELPIDVTEIADLEIELVDLADDIKLFPGCVVKVKQDNIIQEVMVLAVFERDKMFKASLFRGLRRMNVTGIKYCKFSNIVKDSLKNTSRRVSGQFDTFGKYCQDLRGMVFKRQANNIRNNMMPRVRNSIMELTESLWEEYRRLGELESQLMRAVDFGNRRKKHEDIFDENLMAYLLSRCYESINVISCGEVLAVTNDILIDAKTEEDHLEGIINLGTYKVIIDNTNVNKVSITLLSSPENRKTIHPHINAGGKICWGGFAPKVFEAIAAHNYPLALFHIHQFLNSFYSADCYMNPVMFLPEKIRDGYSFVTWRKMEESTYRAARDKDAGCRACKKSIEDCKCHICPWNEKPIAGRFPDNECMSCPYLRWNKASGEEGKIRGECHFNKKMDTSLESIKKPWHIAESVVHSNHPIQFFSPNVEYYDRSQGINIKRET